ncbi:MAG: sulfite exporter TauE/SafE family protein [Tissierellia bacterium]|nr:sulfite exporter TauE/SafE family protein [Tissierellia bacterium]
MYIRHLKFIIIGFITGLINGLFGSGGGILVVPALTFILHFQDYKAHATAIAIILPLTIISTIVYLKNNIIRFDIAIIVGIGAMIGSFIGAKFLKKVPVTILRKVFGGLIIYTAVRMIIL